MREVVMRTLVALGAMHLLVPAQSMAAAPFEAVQIEASAPLHLDDTSAVVVLAFDNKWEMKSARFSVAGKRKVAFTLPTVPAGSQLLIWKVPAGRYCYEKLFLGDFKVAIDPDKLLCFSAKAGHLNHPGIVEFSNLACAGCQRMVFRMRPDVLGDLLHRDRPDLLAPGHRWYFDKDGTRDAARYQRIEADAVQVGIVEAFKPEAAER